MLQGEPVLGMVCLLPHRRLTPPPRVHARKNFPKKTKEKQGGLAAPFEKMKTQMEQVIVVVIDAHDVQHEHQSSVLFMI